MGPRCVEKATSAAFSDDFNAPLVANLPTEMPRQSPPPSDLCDSFLFSPKKKLSPSSKGNESHKSLLGGGGA